MSSPQNPTLGEIIFKDIEKDEYLNELYDALMYDYTIGQFKLVKLVNAKPLNIKDALRFCDILSKSKYNSNSEEHILRSQEMILLLSYLFDNNKFPFIEYVRGSVLQHIGNYQGLKTCNTTPSFDNFLDQFYESAKEKELKIKTSDDKYFLPIQKKIFDSFSKKYVSFSGPTSLGKSFIINNFIKEKIIDGSRDNFAIIVPSRALINQTRNSIILELKDSLANYNFCVVTSCNDTKLQENNSNFIFVMTPERLLNLLKQDEETSIKYVFVDEAHKITSTDKRSIFYYEMISCLKQIGKTEHFIFASPNVPNPNLFLNLLPLNEQCTSMIKTSFSPVCQFKFILDARTNEIAYYNNLNQTFNKLYDYDPSITEDDWIKTIGENKKNIIYCNTPHKAMLRAWYFSKNFEDLNDPALNKLSEEISSELHEDCFLAKVIKRGICYHVGYLPANIRVRIEKAFADKNIPLNYLFCTSTLLEGVNLPAGNLFITSNRKKSLMSQVDFKNLIGRAGRLSETLYGNIFLICNQTDSKLRRSYEKLLTDNPKNLNLALDNRYSDDEKKIIISCIKKGDFAFKNYRFKTPQDYEMVRTVSLSLANDIVRGKDGPIASPFANFIDDSAKQEIIKNNPVDKLPADISISPDQLEALEDAIINKNYRYPEFSDDETNNIDLTRRVLEDMNKIFHWDKYDKSNVNWDSESIQKYSVILYYWMSGKPMNFIIKEIVKMNEKPDKSHLRRQEWENGVQVYKPISVSQFINDTVKEVLDIINNTFLNVFANYFRQFSTSYKEITEQEIDYNWYDYIEYGTLNPIIKTLQQYGFSRSSAIFIWDNKDLYLDDNPFKILVKLDLLNCDNPFVKDECEILTYNSPEFFTK